MESAKHTSEHLQAEQIDSSELFYSGELIRLDNINFGSMLNYLQSNEKKFVYWSEPDYNFQFAGFSPLLEIRYSGENRFKFLKSFYNNLTKNFESNFPDEFKHSIPLLIGGMKFYDNEISEEWSDYTSADFFLPEYLFVRIGEKFFAVINHSGKSIDVSSAEQKAYEMISRINAPRNSGGRSNAIIKQKADGTDTLETWTPKINKILSDIKNNIVSKVVLSRSLLFELSGVPFLPRLLNELESRYPKCYNFIFRSGDSFFFGASPEQLFKISEGLFESDALAGSAPIGANEKLNEKIVEKELFNKKNRAEHASVVEYLKNSLEMFTEKLILENTPSVKKLENIQHLWTPVKANIKSGCSIISVLEKLHPTPAVCGIPVNAAENIIRNLENHQRGLFAGPVGWLNQLGEGEFTVAIRSALYKNDTIRLFAGSGIVKGSEAESEFIETDLKFKPILKLFERKNEN